MEVIKYTDNQRLEKVESSFNFANLPPELRFQVYEYVQPDGLWRSYWLDLNSGQVTWTRRKCRVPALFRAAKWIHVEAMNCILKGNCKIHILQGKIVSNFPLQTILKTWPGSHTELVGEEKVKVELCEKLSIKIQQPSPRVPVEFFEIRRTVSYVVSWLNVCDDVKFSQIEAALDPNRNPTGTTLLCSWAHCRNCGKCSLRQRFRAAQPFDARIQQQCDRLEKVLGGEGGERKRVLEHQQSLLDIRLTVSRIKQNMGWCLARQLERQCERLQLLQWCYDDVNAGIGRLETWCETYDVSPPTWLHELKETINDPTVLRREALLMLNKVMGMGIGMGIGPPSFEHWMAGLSTGFNPFQ